MGIDIHVQANATVVAQKAAKAVEEIFKKYTNHPILFLVSGGSPIEILKYLPKELFDDRVTVGVSDERFSTDPTINNFAQIMFLPAKHWIDTRPQEAETLEGLGVRFDTALKNWKQKNPTGKIVITQGIGLDGHTTGQMPGCIFDDSNVWAVGYDAGNKNKYPLRVTTTMPFLRLVDDSVMYVCGKDKEEPLKRTLASEGDLSVTPSRIIHHMKHCLLFTDQQV